MAGEIEEPFRLSFQADLLHSGSISFGRFESESLSWERRSIFSHNRYLEEVEKYSKPGTVTEKKAYFEAEFRRKALLKQRSSECQDGVDSVRNNGFEDYDNCNESPSYNNPSECESQHKDTVSQHSESQIYEFHPVTAEDELGETHQSENENVAENTEKGIGLTLVDHLVPVDLSSEANGDSLLTCQTPEKDHDSICSTPQTTISPKVKPATEKKLVKSTLKTRVNVDSSQKMILNGASKGPMKPKASESKASPVKKTEKKSPRPASPLIGSRVKTLKAEELRAEKEVKVKAHLPLSQKSLPGVRQTIYRSKQTVNPTRTHMVQSATGLGFKTGQRAENRKEFYTKIVEKMHPKGTEINKFEAKTLEKHAAEMKHVKKSLNFKAKPLPSFYNDQHKVTPITKTTNQPRPRSQATATRPVNTSVPLYARPSSSTSSTNRIRVPENVRRSRSNIAETKDTKSSKQNDPIPKGRDMVKRNVKGVHTWNGPKVGVVS